MARDFDLYLYDPTFSSISFQFKGPWLNNPENRNAVKSLMADHRIENGLRLIVANLEELEDDSFLPLLEKAVRLDPQLDETHFQLGKALAALGRGKEADASFERCFALSPTRRMMALAARWRKVHGDIDFVMLAKNPTIDAWWKLLSREVK